MIFPNIPDLNSKVTSLTSCHGIKLHSIVKDNFHRVSLTEARNNSLFNYDLVSICETCLNGSVKLPETLLDEYNFVPVNNPANTRRGGVGLFYKNSLPVVIRNYLSFEESIVAELIFGRKKYFLLFCIEVLPLIITLLIFKPSYQILIIYMQKSKQKILSRHFLQEILMLIPSNTDTNWQVKTFTEIFLHIMSNYMPNETKRFIPRDRPWITKPIKTMLNRKIRLFKNYKKHRYKDEDKVRLDAFRTECQNVVETAKLTHLKNVGNKVDGLLEDN